MATNSAASGRDGSVALMVAVSWGERLLDVRPVARGEQFEDDGLTYVVSPAAPVERVARSGLKREDLPFLAWVACLLMAFGFSATLAHEYEPESPPEPWLTRAAATMSHTVFRLPPTVLVVQARDRARDDKEQVRSGRPRSAHRPLQAKAAGMLGALDAVGRSPLFERTGLSENIAASLERLSGEQGADAQGLHGFNARHGGSGGPGALLGLGGAGALPRAADGRSLLALNGLRKVNVAPDPTHTEVRGGGIPREVVAKIIARHVNEIRYCYEAELQKNEALAGKVAVVFTIDAAGTVAQVDVAESTLQSAAVEACMLARIGRWKFPEPVGGGVVSVSYPWVFTRAGAAEE